MSRSILTEVDEEDLNLAELQARRAKIYKEATAQLVALQNKQKAEMAALQRKIAQTLERIDREWAKAQPSTQN
jgi:hypothetical protein|nr:MAG TPA: hypothetical protein [Caudoviricetes sp.]